MGILEAQDQPTTKGIAMISAAVMVGGVIVGFVFGKNVFEIRDKAMKYFPDCTSIGHRSFSPSHFRSGPGYFPVSDNFAIVDVQSIWNANQN